MPPLPPSEQFALPGKRKLPSLEVRTPHDGPAPLRWETDLRLENTPHRGGVVRGIAARALETAEQFVSPSDAALRKRLATPKAKLSALAPLQPLDVPSAAHSGQALALQPKARYHLRARKVQALEPSRADDARGVRRPM
ncbi:hypothetical protein KFE25_011566 [Diacronema lutheri]|uniref:Uncharacterized protein n=1 Tax=Diacronema lutheri TaxID=2081491 RepID=A0A8J5X6G0_DIALT|nr:hypothetical protein KFE25_011566 [Diacronema lutheri]